MIPTNMDITTPEDARDAGGAAAMTGSPQKDWVDESGTIHESFDSVATHLIQMEPTDIESLEILRDRFSNTLERWRGPVEVRDELADALKELSEVTENRRSRKAKRLQAVEKISEAIARASFAEEDELTSAPAVATDSGDTDDNANDDPAFEKPQITAQNIEAASEPDVLEVQDAPSSEDTSGEMDADPELINEFVAEGLDYMDQAEEALLGLETNPSDSEAVNLTFRAFHTVKGVSAFLDLTEISHVAHEAETLLSQVREGTLTFTGAAADLLLRSADVLRSLLEGTRDSVNGRSPQPPPGLQPLLAVLADPDLTTKVAANQSLGLTRASSSAEDDGPKSTPSGAAEEAPTASAASEDSVRIRTDRLDQLVNLVGELVVAHSMIGQDPELLASVGHLGKKVSHSQKILRELQDLSTSLRMVPLKPAFHKISRVVRDLSKKSGKPVELVTRGEETELDRSMVAVITDPLVHMVRNSVDHGIESEQDRVAAGKPARGTVTLTARQAGGNVVVEIEDDGRGLDRDKILAKAIDKGLVDPERTLADEEVFALIFQPGFSTAQQVTDISGRGVGMDVVRRAVESLRGRIEIKSALGKGTRFYIYLPLTLAITDGMLVRVGKERYIIPTMKIHLSFRPSQDDIWSVSGRGEMVMLHDQLIPIAKLHRLFGVDGAEDAATKGLLVVVGEGSRKTAILVDELVDQQQFVVKPLTGRVSGTVGLAGGAILGDGGVGLIVDPDELVQLARGDATPTTH